MKDVVSAMNVINPLAAPAANFAINYEPGRSIQILKSINDFDNSISMQGLKYPLIAMLMPIRESRGSGFYGDVTIPRIVIATLTKTGNGTEPVLYKYDSAGTFKTVLYPLYNEFLKQIGRNKNFLPNDHYAIEHTKMDNPGQQPIGEGSLDYIDSIEILDLKLKLIQIKNC